MSASSPHRTAEWEFGALLSELADLGPPSEIRARAPELAARALALDRILLSSVGGGLMRAEALYIEHDSRRRKTAPETLDLLRAEPVSLAYPLIEAEVVRQRRCRIVRAGGDDPPERSAFAGALAWTDYIVAPVLLDGQVVGLLQGDRRATGGELADADAGALSTFAVCFALVYERATLRYRLRVQRDEMRRVASWADTRSSDLGERAIVLADEAGSSLRAVPPTPAGVVESGLRDPLTQREIDVLRLVTGGETNAGIARSLVISEGTVKFHVKNILRKLGASNRAEATSRYLRMTREQAPGTGR
jgi:DNA-binding CsgD family transcriptional regulator